MAARDEPMTQTSHGMGADAPPRATEIDPPVLPQSIAQLDQMMQSMGFGKSGPQLEAQDGPEG